MTPTPRILIHDHAKQVIDTLREQYGDLIFHQSGGCCDGSSPICFIEGEFMLNETDVYLGSIHDCPFYMAADQFEYWKHTQLTLNVTEGRGASFSLEIPMGVRFIIESRIYTAQEAQNLSPVTTMG